MKNLSRALILFIFLAFPVQAANSLDIVINEIAWMGTEISYADEWIELYNNTDSPLNLDGWILKAEDGSPEILLPGWLPGRSFYLLERADDNTVPNIPADQIYTGALENNGENLELYDNFGNLIDSVNCNSGWFGGDNSTKQTMERKNPSLPGSHPGSWQTSQNPGGTPKAKNSRGAVQKTKSEAEPPKIEESKIKEGLAAVGEQVPKRASFSTLLIALAMATFSGIIILTLKKTTTRPPRPPKLRLGPY